MKDEFGRPDWDSFFLSMCFLIARRSLDQHTKHGCVIVDEHKRILSTGYNGPPGGLDDTTIPLNRPDKYRYMEHSELNAILNAKGKDLNGSTFYITGFPCHTCFRQMKIVGAKKIVHAGQGSVCLTEEDAKAISILNGTNAIEIVHCKDLTTIIDIYGDSLNKVLDAAPKGQ